MHCVLNAVWTRSILPLLTRFTIIAYNTFSISVVLEHLVPNGKYIIESLPDLNAHSMTIDDTPSPHQSLGSETI